MKLIVFLIALAFWWLFLKARRRRPAIVTTLKPPLSATVWIAPSGESLVAFNPDTADSEQLVRLMLCYGSKVRWLLHSEPAKSTQVFQDLMATVINQFSAPKVHDLMTDVPVLTETRRNTVGAPVTVPGGELFSVRLLYGAYGEAAVANSLPSRGLAFNIPWHYLLLCHAIHRRLTQEERCWAQLALQAWFAEAFSASQSSQSLKALNSLNAAANQFTDRARKIA
jgi:hypothetical protein